MVKELPLAQIRESYLLAKYYHTHTYINDEVRPAVFKRKYGRCRLGLTRCPLSPIQPLNHEGFLNVTRSRWFDTQ